MQYFSFFLKNFEELNHDSHRNTTQIHQLWENQLEVIAGSKNSKCYTHFYSQVRNAEMIFVGRGWSVIFSLVIICIFVQKSYVHFDQLSTNTQLWNTSKEKKDLESPQNQIINSEGVR
jgi:hypothetical protein